MGYLVEEVSLGRFIEAFQSDPIATKSFSREGLIALYDYLTDLAANLEDDITLDTCELRGRYWECPEIGDYNREHGTNFADWKEVPACVALVGERGAIVDATLI